MSLKDKRSGFLSWLAPGSWLVVAVLLGVYVGTPALKLEAPTLAWVVTLGIVVFALTHLAHPRHGSLPASRARHEPRGLRRGPSKGGGPRHAPPPPCWYKGRSHSGERPRFD